MSRPSAGPSGPEAPPADAAVIRALVVDDEPPARRRLVQLLEATGRVKVVAQARSVARSLEAAAPQDLDVAFLDVHMPVEDGFAYLERTLFEVPVVFVTAYSSFALRAFEVAALDYLLKPVEASRLSTSLDRVARERRRSPGGQRGPSAPPVSQGVVCLPVTAGARFVPLRAIICILARDDYTEVTLDDGSAALVSVTMRAWEERLAGDGFTRLHRGAIAASGRIERVERHGGHWLAWVRGLHTPIPVNRDVARELVGRSKRP